MRSTEFVFFVHHLDILIRREKVKKYEKNF